MTDLEFYNKLIEAVKAGGAVVYTALEGVNLGQKALLTGGKLIAKNEALLPMWSEAVKCKSFTYNSLPCSDVVFGTMVLAEKITTIPRLVICGGGHISQPLAVIGELLGFEVTVIDDRAEFANAERFPKARVLCQPFDEALDSLDAGNKNTYYVIITRGHSADSLCLERILKKCPSAVYIGMIGSKQKVAVVMEQMIMDGCSPQLLGRVKAPIGLKIGAQSPAEIAVSIAAEMVQVRNVLSGEGCLSDEMFELLNNPEKGMVIATITEKTGSAPRGVGAKMFVSAQGRILSGSVGGGSGEAVVCEAARGVSLSGAPIMLDCSMTNDDAKEAGMVCGGTLRVLLEVIEA